MATTINSNTTDGLVITPDTSGEINLQANGSTITSITANGMAVDTNTLYVDATNNRVGIGTTTPSNSLHLYGSSSALRVERTGSDSASLITKTTLGHYGVGTGIGTATNCFNVYDYGASSERMRIDSSGNLQFNSGYGSVATAYACRAWVKFANTTGTPTIQGSGNVSSITDNAVGKYTVNMTTAMPDTNYSVVTSCGDQATSDQLHSTGTNGHFPSYTTSSFKFATTNSTQSYQDKDYNFASVFR